MESSNNRALPGKLFLGLFILLQVLVIGIAFLGGYLVREWFPQVSQGGDLPLLHRAEQLLTQNAYDPLPKAPALEYGMIRGMLQAMNDPFTTFYEPPQAELQTNTLQGHFGGIGVRLERDKDNNFTLIPLPDSPALKAGIQEGDRLVKVDDKEITNDTPDDQVQAAIRGKAGETVRIAVTRKPGYDKPVEYKMVRAEVALPSVTWNLAPDEAKVGVIQINVMAETTADEVTKAIKDLQSRGAAYFVLDLRNNGGGLVDAGVNTARLFLKSGTVIEEQYHNQPVKKYSVDHSGPYTDLPLVILVNKGTASATEMLAGSLQAQKRAQLVGTPTYGKDSIQLVFDLGDGSSLHVTSARWWIPGLSTPLHGNGLQPDVSAPDDGPVKPLQKAIQILLSR